MNVFRSVRDWRQFRRSTSFPKGTIGLVPTMGALHEGHRSLLERARRECERVILTIFVNPAQFNDPRDLERYPRTLDADLALASGLADFVVVPSPGDMYPDQYAYRVSENLLSTQLEGAHRPGHFDGVLTVVLKLLNLTRPDRAYFGEKDWQQLQLVDGLVNSFFLECEIVHCPTIRDPDGLALSSRNQRLSPEARQRAARFPALLREAKNAGAAAASLAAAGFEVDYVVDRDGIRLGAIRLEGVRLIDNAPL